MNVLFLASVLALGQQPVWGPAFSPSVGGSIEFGVSGLCSECGRRHKQSRGVRPTVPIDRGSTSLGITSRLRRLEQRVADLARSDVGGLRGEVDGIKGKFLEHKGRIDRLHSKFDTLGHNLMAKITGHDSRLLKIVAMIAKRSWIGSLGGAGLVILVVFLVGRRVIPAVRERVHSPAFQERTHEAQERVHELRALARGRLGGRAEAIRKSYEIFRHRNPESAEVQEIEAVAVALEESEPL